MTVFNKKGFTLMELIVYIAIFAILMLVVSSFVLGLIKVNTKYQTKREVAENAMNIMKTLSYEIQQASSIYTPTSALGSSPGQLSLETTLNLPTDEKRTYIDFYLDSENLYLKREGVDPLKLNSANTKITNLVFEKFKPEAVKIQLTVAYKSPATKPEYQFSYFLVSAVLLRN